MAGVLSSVRVVDFGQFVAGPLAAVMLADQGANVIHVDPPEGPRLAGTADAFLNRNKRRVCLDLKSSEGVRQARELVDGADVVIENFRPGVMDRLGLGAEGMRASRPNLIYCSLPGFPASDPRADIRAWEGIINAATGNSEPRNGEEPPGWDWDRPTYSALPLASSIAGYLAATSVVMALIARARTGRGQVVEVPLYDAMFTLIANRGAYKDSSGLGGQGPIHGRGAGCYRCGDGRYVQFDTASPRHLTWFARAAGVTAEWGPELLDLQESARPDVNDVLHARLRELFLTKTAEEWEAIGNQAGAAISVVRTLQEWLRTDHARAIGAATRVVDPALGEMWTAGSPIYLSRSTSGPIAARQTPGQGSADPHVRWDKPHDADDAGTVPSHLAQPLSGLRVIDLGGAVAGPTCGRLLYEYGADVIKIDPPHKGMGGHLNRGKQSMLADLSTLHGQEIYWKLVERADIVLENMAPAAMDKLGTGYEEVRARRPDIVYTAINCYGFGGPWSAGRGWERQGQAVSGIMERTALPSVLGPYNLVDIGTGVLATFATALGVLHKLNTGTGQLVGASLCQAATYHQAIFSFDYPGYRPSEVRGYDVLGTGPLDRFYRGSDTWFYIAASSAERTALLETVAGDLVDVEEARLEAALEERFRTQPAREWVDALTQVGIAAYVNTTTAEAMKDAEARSRGVITSQDVDGAGPCTMPGVSVQMSDTPLRVGAVRPPGSDGAELLAEIEMSDRLEALEREWVVRTRDLRPAWPTR